MRDPKSLIEKQEAELKAMREKVETMKKIEEFFEMNFERLRMESGHTLAPEAKRQAFLQILMYFEKLPHIAKSVTDTEVKLTLPQQSTPEGRRFTIEGVVDIIRDQATHTTTMYDVKTHDANLVEQNRTDYEKQLNVYTHIWQELMQRELDETAVIATQFPRQLKRALDADNDQQVEHELSKWEPVVSIPFSQQKVEETIQDFAQVVDCIERRDFSPPELSTLQERVPGTRQRFATRVCRNCDARFSCDAYRAYSQQNANFAGGFAEYISDLGEAAEVENWTNTNSVEAPPPPNIEDEI